MSQCNLVRWAAAKVNAAGAYIDKACFSGTPTKTRTGVYELTLEAALGVAECCPTVTPWYPASTASAPQTWGVAGLKSDGVTLVVNLFSNVGGVAMPTDSAFCVVVERFMPE
jgi:hypothetical protein